MSPISLTFYSIVIAFLCYIIGYSHGEKKSKIKMKTHQIDCPKCKAKKSITWTQKLKKDCVEVVINKCTECNEVSDVVNEPQLKEYKEQEYYLD